jgi:acyl-activating enzyme 14
MLAVGARHVFLPRFEGHAALRAIQQQGVTSFIAVPTMVADLLAAASEARVGALPSVARVLVGGGGMSPALQAGLAALCPAAAVHAAYGMTEGASSLTFTTLWAPGCGPSSASLFTPSTTATSAAAAPQQHQQAAAAPAGGVFVGRPPPGIELAIYHAPPGGDVACGGGRVQLAGEGEVLTRGPHVMLGYWDDEAATAAAQLPGGWLRTGDLGCLRQGGCKGCACLLLLLMVLLPLLLAVNV